MCQRTLHSVPFVKTSKLVNLESQQVRAEEPLISQPDRSSRTSDYFLRCFLQPRKLAAVLSGTLNAYL